jgi:hypothetical protein
MIRTPDRLFYVPSEAVAALSKSLLEAGDVTALLAAS